MSKIANGARSAGGGCTIAAAIGVGYLSARLFSVKKKREPSVPGQSAGWDRVAICAHWNILEFRGTHNGADQSCQDGKVPFFSAKYIS
ncbi:MAG: hypothetical protein DMF15_06470 [Verrucomicrobia bacterium]|nr:MAG: hypothetical protein DMF15_06470 [Verrucomicrobiota bacterium]